MLAKLSISSTFSCKSGNQKLDGLPYMGHVELVFVMHIHESVLKIKIFVTAARNKARKNVGNF